MTRERLRREFASVVGEDGEQARSLRKEGRGLFCSSSTKPKQPKWCGLEEVEAVQERATTKPEGGSRVCVRVKVSREHTWLP